MRFTRITADLSRPVPMAPCTVAAIPLRDGKRVQSVEATISYEGTVMARAVGTRIRVAADSVPVSAVPPRHPGDETPPMGTEVLELDYPDGSFHDCVEMRRLDDHAGTLNRTWFRLTHPLVENETPSPTVVLASIADMISSAGTRLGEGWVSINPEVSLQIEREPVGEWICVSSTVRFGTDGIGVSNGVLYDRDGRVGASAKSFLNMKRDP